MTGLTLVNFLFFECGIFVDFCLMAFQAIAMTGTLQSIQCQLVLHFTGENGGIVACFTLLNFLTFGIRNLLAICHSMMAFRTLECILVFLVREYRGLFTAFTQSDLGRSRVGCSKGQEGCTTHYQQRHNSTGKKFFQHVCSPLFEKLTA